MGFEVKCCQTLAGVEIDGLSVTIETEIAAGGNGQFDYAFADAFKVDFCGSLFRFCIRTLAFTIFCRFITFGSIGLVGRRGFHFGIFGKEWRRSVGRKEGKVYAFHIVIDVVPFQRAVGWVEITGGGEQQIFIVERERWAA